MGEGNRVCVKVEPIAGGAIEHIANNGTVKPMWVRGVHSQLMSTPCERRELYESVVSTIF